MSTQDDTKNNFFELKESLCKEIDIGGLFKRNPVAHKWKVTNRCLTIREASAWRFYDLIEQSVNLYFNSHKLGAEILLRSALETLAIIIFTNQKMESIIRTKTGFHEFSKSTTRLLLGSKNDTTKFNAINVLSILQKCEKRYSGIISVYNNLSEVAHPNYEGLCRNYTKFDSENLVTSLGNFTEESLNDIPKIIETLTTIFDTEYNDIWPLNFDKFEIWIEKNDAQLEASKPA